MASKKSRGRSGGEGKSKESGPAAPPAPTDEAVTPQALETPGATPPPPERAPGAASNPAEDALADFARRTLRLWGGLGVVYGAVLAAAVAVWIPWKSPGINAALIAYALLHAVAGGGLLRRASWAWRVAVAAGLIGLAAAVLVCGGLLASWAYLHGIFGDFGWGAGIAALLFATVAAQVLGLYPALLLRALLRREVRARFGAGRAAGRATAALLLAPVLVAVVLHQRHALSPLPPVSEAGRQEAITYLRALLRGREAPSMPALEGVPVGRAPVVVSLWERGRRVALVRGDGPDLAAALASAGAALKTHPRLAGRRVTAGRLKVDRVVAVGPVVSEWAPVLALSVNPGLDGLRRIADDGAETLLLADDLVAMQAFGHAPLVPGIRELRFGLDAVGVLTRLGMPEARLERVRTEGWVEMGTRALPAARGNTPPPALGPDAWRKAAVAGGDFVLRQIMEDGRFHYQYFPFEDRHPDPARVRYSLPRHAGTVYSLALLYGVTGEARFKVGAERAIAWLDTRIPPSCGGEDRACVTDGNVADLGSTALTLVGMLEYTRRTQDRRYEANIRRLGNFVLALQREDGDFDHVWLVHEARTDPTKRLMFYSEEAALALVMLHELFGEDRWLHAAERALDYLTGPKYEYFVGRFIYGADHWTCIAAGEAWPRLKHRRYLDFCDGYSEFIRRMQYEPGRWSNADFTGHYGFTGFMVPQAPAAAGFSEAVVSTVELARAHGVDASALERQVELALDALVRDQIRLDNAWMMPKPRAALGGFRRSLVEQEVRIDFTQHALSALIRGAELY